MARINKKRNITGYSVQEDATPINAASTEGGVGTITFGTPDADDVLDLYGTEITLDDKYRGQTLGDITQIERTDRIVTFTADQPLGKLVGTQTAQPMQGTFQQVAEYYLSLGGVSTPRYFDDALSEILVDAPGWNDDVWLKLKQLCTAYQVEVTLVSDNIVFRPARTIVLNPKRLTDITETLESDDVAHKVEINYYNNAWKQNILVYPRSVDETADAQVYQVEAGAVLEDDIQTTVSLASIQQPVCVADVTQDYDGTTSVYSVRAVDNSVVTPTQWAAGGGKIELSINDDTTSIHIKITASNDQYYGPYRIAGMVYEPDDPSQIVTPPSSTIDSPQVTQPTEPTAPTEPTEPGPKPTAPTKPTKPAKVSSKTWQAYLKAEAKYKKDYAAYKKALKKYEAANKAADVEQKRRDAEADAINAIRNAMQDYPSLRIAGTGVFFDKETLTLPTGIADDRTADDIGVTVDNIFIDTEMEAYTTGVYVASRYRGENHTLSATVQTINQRDSTGAILFYTVNDFNIDYQGMTIAQFNTQWAGKTIGDFNADAKAQVVDNFENQVFGNVTGARFQYKDAMFRITNATTSQDNVQITAVRDTMIRDFNWVHAGQTIADFNNLYRGKTLKQFARMPLKGGS